MILIWFVLFASITLANIAIYYPFDGDFKRELGQCPYRTDVPEYGTGVNVSFVTSASSNLGQAVAVGAWPGYVHLGQFLLNSDSGSHSVTFWVRLGNLSEYQPPLYTRMLAKERVSYLFRFYFYQGENKMMPLVPFTDMSTSTGYQGAYDFGHVFPLKSNAWYHMAAVFNFTSNTLRYYINGTYVAERITSGAPLDSPSDDLQLFCSVGLAWCPVQMAIDDLRIYTEAIPVSEIVRQVTQPARPRSPRLNTTLELAQTIAAHSPLFLGGNATDVDTAASGLTYSWLIEGYCQAVQISHPNASQSTFTFADLGSATVHLIVSDGYLCDSIAFSVTVVSSLPTLENSTVPAEIVLSASPDSSTVVTVSVSGTPEPTVQWQRYDPTNATGTLWNTLAFGNPMTFVSANSSSSSSAGNRTERIAGAGEDPAMGWFQPPLISTMESSIVKPGRMLMSTLPSSALRVSGGPLAVYPGEELRVLVVNPGGSVASATIQVRSSSVVGGSSGTSTSASNSGGGGASDSGDSAALSGGALAGAIVGPLAFALVVGVVALVCCCGLLLVCLAVLCVVLVAVLAGVGVAALGLGAVGVAGPSAVLAMRLRGRGERQVRLHAPDFWQLALGRLMGEFGGEAAGDAATGARSSERVHALGDIANDGSLCSALADAVFRLLDRENSYASHEAAVLAMVTLAWKAQVADEVLDAFLEEDSAREKIETLFRGSSRATKWFTVLVRVSSLPYLFDLLASPMYELSTLMDTATSHEAAAASDSLHSGSGAESGGGGGGGGGGGNSASRSSTASSTSGGGGGLTASSTTGSFKALLTATNIDSLLENPVGGGGGAAMESLDWELNALELRLMLQKLLVALLKAQDSVPHEIRAALSSVDRAAARLYERCGEEYSAARRGAALGSFYFLRFINPALSAPFLFGLLPEPPSARTQQRLIMFSRAFQNLSNRTLPGLKDPSFAFMNDFVRNNEPKVDEFFNSVLASPGPSTSVQLPYEYHQACLYALENFLALKGRDLIPLVSDPVLSKMIDSFF